MPTISIKKLFEDNQDALGLQWEIPCEPECSPINSDAVNSSTNGLIGHLNLIHPNWIQIFSRTEAALLQRHTISISN
jgi:HPr kinase/phosphorylase